MSRRTGAPVKVLCSTDSTVSCCSEDQLSGRLPACHGDLELFRYPFKLLHALQTRTSVSNRVSLTSCKSGTWGVPVRRLYGRYNEDRLFNDPHDAGSDPAIKTQPHICAVQRDHFTATCCVGSRFSLGAHLQSHCLKLPGSSAVQEKTKWLAASLQDIPFHLLGLWVVARILNVMRGCFGRQIEWKHLTKGHCSSGGSHRRTIETIVGQAKLAEIAES